MGQPRILQLGCGIRPMSGAVNHDRIIHHEYVDVAHDLDQLPWPWEDESFDVLTAYDVTEHLKIDVIDWLCEAWRILAPGGTFSFRVPAWDNPVSYRDFTHQRVFHPESFDYVVKGTRLWLDYGHFYFAEQDRWWQAEPAQRVNGGDLLFRLTKLQP